MTRDQLARLGRVARCTECGARHWRPAASAPGANLAGAEWQAWHAASLAAGAPVVCDLCHWMTTLRARGFGGLVADMAAALVADMAAELVA